MQIILSDIEPSTTSRDLLCSLIVVLYPYMVINVSLQVNGGLLPDIILLTRCDHIGEPSRYHEDSLSLQPIFTPKSFDIFSPEGGCSEGLDAFRFFFKQVDL